MEAAEPGLRIFDPILFINSINSDYMRKIFLLAATALVLTGLTVTAGGGKSKQKDCTTCTKQNCSGQKCADCCAHGKCTKG